MANTSDGMGSGTSVQSTLRAQDQNERIKELERENAELRETIVGLSQIVSRAAMQGAIVASSKR